MDINSSHYSGPFQWRIYYTSARTHSLSRHCEYVNIVQIIYDIANFPNDQCLPIQCTVERWGYGADEVDGGGRKIRLRTRRITMAKLEEKIEFMIRFGSVAATAAAVAA